MPNFNSILPSNTILQARYRVSDLLGAGNMGAVYLAYDLENSRRVAIKQNTRDEAWLREQFKREAAILYGLRHPVLPEVFDYFMEGGNQYLVMKYIPGLDLKQTMSSSSTPFEVKAVEAWVSQLLSGLDYMHTQPFPVIHRDIKPANIKVTTDGKVYLLDFGLARGGAPPGDSNAQTVFGCTVDYASPEQILRVNADVRSTLTPFLTQEEIELYVYSASAPRNDIYSLAASLYHLLTRTRPPQANQRLAEVKNGRPDPLRPANQLRPDIPGRFARALMLSMELNLNDRPASAAEMRSLIFPDEDKTQAERSTLTSAAIIPIVSADRPPRSKRLSLYVLGPPNIRRTVDLDIEELIIGREEGEVRLPADSEMAARHACIFRRDNQIFVKELEPHNGIYKRIIKETELVEDDMILIADLEFKIHYARSGIIQLKHIIKDGLVDHVYNFNLNEVTIGTASGLYKFSKHQSAFMAARQARLVRRPNQSRFVLVDESPTSTNFKKIRGEEPLREGDLLFIGTTFFSVGLSPLD